MEGKTINLCVLGAGRHSSEVHGPVLAKLQGEGGVRLGGICDLNGEKAEDYRKSFNFNKAYTDVDTMLQREQPDALMAITSISDIEPIAMELIRHRIPLLIEKPPGPDSATARRLLKASEAFQTPVMVSLNRRHHPALRKAMVWLKERDLQPAIITATMLRGHREREAFISHTGIHLIDAALSLMGDPVKLDLRSSCYSNSVHPTATAHLETANGMVCQLLLAPQSGCHEETYLLTAPGFRVFIDVFRQTAIAYEGDCEVESWKPTPSASNGLKLLDVEQETKAFLGSIRCRQHFIPDLATAERSLRLAEAIENSECGKCFERLPARGVLPGAFSKAPEEPATPATF